MTATSMDTTVVNSEVNETAFQKSLPSNQGEWLKLVIKMTEKQGPQFSAQLKRLQDDLQTWEDNQSRTQPKN